MGHNETMKLNEEITAQEEQHVLGEPFFSHNEKAKRWRDKQGNEKIAFYLMFHCFHLQLRTLMTNPMRKWRKFQEKCWLVLMHSLPFIRFEFFLWCISGRINTNTCPPVVVRLHTSFRFLLKFISNAACLFASVSKLVGARTIGIVVQFRN